MSAAVPSIYSPQHDYTRLGVAGRILAAIIAAACITPLAVAACLPPSPTGVGTHTQLGMFPCYMLQTTGVPCMACGMTTSFAWFARGNLLASLYIQPMGMVLALLSVMSFWGGLYIALTGRQVYRLLSYLPGRLYFVPLTTWAVLAWGWKIFIHLQHLDGWRV